MKAEKYPLQWPLGYPRERYPSRSRFGNKPFGKTRDEIFRQLKLMLSWRDRDNVILSTNVPLKIDGYPYANYRQPEDKGVAVYFRYQDNDIVICCDKWELPEVLGMTLEAFTYIYGQLTGETFPRGPSRIPVKAVELVQQVQAMKKEGKQLKGL